MIAFTQKLALDRRSLLRVLLGVYLFPLSLVCFSLSVPPADLPLYGLLFVLAVVGVFLARRESRAWRFIWTGALIAAVVFGVLEVVAGRRLARQRSEHALMPNKPDAENPAMTLRFAMEDQWRRVSDLGRWTMYR